MADTAWCPICNARREVIDESLEYQVVPPWNEVEYRVRYLACEHQIDSPTGKRLPH